MICRYHRLFLRGLGLRCEILSRRSFSENCEGKRFLDIVEQLYSTPFRKISAKKIEAKYFFEGHFRYVYPYIAIFQQLIEHHYVGNYASDFAVKSRALPPGLVNLARESGLIRVNKKKLDADYKLKSKDILQVILHHHESPILAVKPKVVYQNEDLYVVDKPPTMPIHAPSKLGGFNSLLKILEYDQKMKVGAFYRIDSPTSGLVILSSNKELSRQFQSEMTDKQVEKTYLAEVMGDFPSGETIVDVPLFPMDLNNIVLVDKVFGKPSRSIFRKVKSKASTSLLECNIETGRSHQIRVHLQYLGFPVVNDYIYASEEIFGPNLGKNGSYEHYDNLKVKGKVREHFLPNDSDGDDELAVCLNHYSDDKWKSFIESHQYKPELDETFEDCVACGFPRQKPEYKRFLHLHALRYKNVKLEIDFSTDPPFWWDG